MFYGLHWLVSEFFERWISSCVPQHNRRKGIHVHRIWFVLTVDHRGPAGWLLVVWSGVETLLIYGVSDVGSVESIGLVWQIPNDVTWCWGFWEIWLGTTLWEDLMKKRYQSCHIFLWEWNWSGSLDNGLGYLTKWKVFIWEYGVVIHCCVWSSTCIYRVLG